VPGLLRSSGDDSGDPLEPPKPSNFESVKQEVLRLASIADPTERLLEVAAVIGESLSDLGVQPVVVGGLALAYWSDNDEFITGDIDVLVPRVPELPVRLQALGFEQRGRDWILPGHDVSSRLAKCSNPVTKANGQSWPWPTSEGSVNRGPAFVAASRVGALASPFGLSSGGTSALVRCGRHGTA